MSLLTRSISKLSQINVNADKDWNTRGISNLKQLAAGMVQGDLIVKGGGGVLVRLPAGIANTVLTSAGPGVLPSWQPGGTFYNRYYPATIPTSSVVPSIVTIASQINKTASTIVSSYKQALTDTPDDYLSMKTPAVTSSITAGTDSVDETFTKTIPVGSTYSTSVV